MIPVGFSPLGKPLLTDDVGQRSAPADWDSETGPITDLESSGFGLHDSSLSEESGQRSAPADWDSETVPITNFESSGFGVHDSSLSEESGQTAQTRPEFYYSGQQDRADQGKGVHWQTGPDHLSYEDGTQVNPNDRRLLEDSNFKGKGPLCADIKMNRTIRTIDQTLANKYRGSRGVPISEFELDTELPMLYKYGTKECTDQEDLREWKSNMRTRTKHKLFTSDDWGHLLESAVYPVDKKTGECDDPYDDIDFLKPQLSGVYSVARASELGIGSEYSLALNHMDHHGLTLTLSSTQKEAFWESEKQRAAISNQVYRPMVEAAKMPKQDTMIDSALQQIHFAIPKGEKIFTVHDDTLEAYSETPETAGDYIKTKEGVCFTEDGLRNKNFSTIHQTLTTDDDDFLWKTGNYEQFCLEALIMRQSGVSSFIAADEKSYTRILKNLSRFQGEEDHVISNEGKARSRFWTRAEDDRRNKKVDPPRTFTQDQVEAVWREQDPSSWHRTDNAMTVSADTKYQTSSRSESARSSEDESSLEPVSDMKQAAARRSSKKFRDQRSSDQKEESDINERSHKLRNPGRDDSYLDLARSSGASEKPTRLKDEVTTDHLDLAVRKPTSGRNRSASARWDAEDSKRWAADPGNKLRASSSNDRTTSQSSSANESTGWSSNGLDDSRSSRSDFSEDPTRPSVTSDTRKQTTSSDVDRSDSNDDRDIPRRYKHRRAASDYESPALSDDPTGDTS